MGKPIPQNQSTADRFIRIIIGGACLIIPSYIYVPNVVLLGLLVIGFYLMLTGLAGQCFVYKLFDVKTCK
ncbi:MAG: DUF2892 domain-containing protein [Candidatus Margulisbacteria bacterium]|nr:DUF2892 domain-containing protein [Candidatus Margulisiibacteriota bacterium]